MYQNDLLIRAIRGEKTSRPPIWMMRQAGRTDPQYNQFKESLGLRLEELFRHPEHAATISLLPKRIGVDAIIYFQDILTSLTPLGCHFVFRPGPVTDTPIRTPDDVDRLTPYDVEKELPFIAETFACIDKNLNQEIPVLGFAGAPLTLAIFMIEGKSFGSSIDQSLQFIHTYPDATRKLLDITTQMTIDYLKYQARSGVAAVQLFESAAFLLTPEIYQEYALPYQQRIMTALRDVVPTIMFAREWENVADLHATGANILSLPATCSVSQVRAELGKDLIVQGNLDNHLLAHGEWSDIEKAAHACIQDGQCQGHIFNLSHGLLRETPFDHVQKLVQLVTSYGD
jgi:uroporphyrinogen decarboxylase